MLTFVNAAAASLLGYTPEEVLELGMAGIVHPDDYPSVVQYATERFAGKDVPSQYQLRFIAKDGEVRWGDVSVSLIELDGGPAVAGTVFDITEARRIADEMRESTANWRGLFDTYPGFIGTIDTKGNISALNRAPLPLKVDQLIGLPSSLFVDPSFKPLWEKAIANVLSCGSTEYLENPGPLRDEHGPFWYGVTLGPIMRDGKVSAAAVVSNDITGIKRSEVALRHSEERWRSLVETAPDFISLISQEGTLLAVNRTLSFRTTEEAIGHSVFEFVHADDAERWRQALRPVFLEGKTEHVESRAYIPGVGVRWFATRIGPIWKDGVVTAANAVTSDITDRKRMEDALRESEAHMRALIEAVPAFITTVDRNGVVLTVSRVTPGVPVSDVIGHSVFEWQAPSFTTI